MKKSEMDWEAENDFRTLSDAEAVKADSKRLARAKQAGKRLVAQETKALTTKRKIIKNSPRKRKG